MASSMYAPITVTPKRRTTVEWKREVLRNSDLFAGCRCPELESLTRAAVFRRLRRGDILQLAGDPPAGVYVVAAGALRLFRQNPLGREQVLSTAGTGGVVGLAPLFDGGPYFATIVADEDPTELLLIDRRTAECTCRESPELLCRVLKIVSSRVRRYAELVDALALHDVDRRVAWFLLQQAPGARTFELTVTHRQIAARVASVRERVTRAFARLQHEGLIVVQERTITIPNRTILAEFASR